MKTFRTTGTGNEQTLSEIETDKIPLYPTEQDLLDDLANLEVGQLAGTIDPAESELIGVLIQKIQALESKLESDDVYSTDEVKTNKKWIDGKSIYRKVIEYNGSISGSSAVTLADLLPSANYVDTSINGRAIGLRDNNNLKKMSVSLDWWLLESNTKTVVVQILSTMYCKQIILEYTKTTED